MSLEIDFETRSSVDLKVHGAYRYFASPDADVLMASFSFDGQPVRRWRRGDHCPGDVYDWICDGGHIMAHNAQFERLAFQFVMGPKYGWPMPRIDQFRCTAAMAAAMSLPRHLDGLGEALNLRQQKDKGGFGLIRKFSIPKKATGLFTEPEDDPEAFERFHAYCDRDVEAEAEVARHFEEVQQLRAALTQSKSAATAEALGLVDKVQAARAEADELRGKLREEERVRAQSQRVDAAARRLIQVLRDRKEDPAFSLLLSSELEQLGAAVDGGEIAGSRDPAISDFDALRTEMQAAWAREDRSRSDVVTDVLHALRERGLLRA